MSFFGDLVSSIGTDKVPPPRPPSRPNSANTPRPANSDIKNGPRQNANAAVAMSAGTKRKADEISTVSKVSKTAPEAALTRQAAPPLHASKAQPPKASTAPGSQPNQPMASSRPKPSTPVTPAESKPAPKGSYAEMMARAKLSAEQRAQSAVGMIKHQDTKKDKMSKLAERRKMEQDKARGVNPVSTTIKNGRPVSRRSASPAKIEPAKAKPAAPAKSTYKGTMGMSASRRAESKGRPKARRYDEYLGTDEEDNSDIDEDEDDYGSNASSDMEAGFDDMEVEESRALKSAKEDDARELALENQLKREKDERRRKLESLAASKRKR
jgi:hypothetical protein